MSKVEITDEMVERAAKAWRIPLPEGGDAWSLPIVAREMLNAALNPPKEPEIEVTEEMTIAGIQVAYCDKHPLSGATLAEIYRAMHAAISKEELPLPNRRRFDRRGANKEIHRRKDNP